ncbi:MAG: hypothetical protein QXF12_00120 [Candidatus Aenigmatarchaeota archaeon]
MRASTSSASPETVLENIHKNIFNNKEYIAFINAVKNKFKVSSLKFISAEEISNELVLSINELKSKVSAVSGTESSMVVKTPAFVSYPGTGKTKGIEATLQNLKNKGFIKNFIYHDMMKHDPISAPFGVTILKKEIDSSVQESDISGFNDGFDRQSNFVRLLTNMFYSVISLNVIRANKKLERGEGLYLGSDHSQDFDLKGLDLNAVNNSFHNICINVYTHLKSRMYPKNSNVSEHGILNKSEFTVLYYYSKMVVFYSFINAVSIIIQDYNKNVKSAVVDYMISENAAGLIRFLSLVFLVSMTRFMAIKVSDSDKNKGNFFIRNMILFTYLFIKDFYLNLNDDESFKNSLLRFYNVMLDNFGESYVRDFISIGEQSSDDGILSFVKRISVNYFESLFGMIQSSFSEDDYVSESIMEEMKSVMSIIDNMKGKSFIVGTFFLDAGSTFVDENIISNNLKINARITSKEEEFSNKKKAKKDRMYSLPSDSDYNVTISDYFMSIDDNMRNFISGYYYLFNILRKKIDSSMSVILGNDKDLNNIDYSKTVDLFNLISSEGKGKGLRLESSDESLVFVFPKHVEDFLRNARSQYEKWLSSRNKKFINDLKEGGIQRYEVSDPDVYVLFLDEVFHMFSGDGAPIVATIWDGLANRADKFPPNVLLVLAGNSPTSAFFDSLMNNSSKISNDSMKAFFDRLKLRFVIPDVNFIYHRVGDYLSGFISKKSSIVSESVNNSVKNEVNNIYNKKITLNHFDYYSNIFKLRLTDSQYCSNFESKYNESILRHIIQYATNFEGRDESLLNISLKDKVSYQSEDLNILVYANVMKRFHEKMESYLLDSRRASSGSDFVNKYLQERYEFFWENRDIISIPKFAHLWLVSVVNAHYLLMNILTSSLSNYQESSSRGIINYKTPEVLVSLGNNFANYYVDVSGNKYDRISSDLLYANVFYTLVAISYVSSVYNYGRCIECVKNIANLYDSVIGSSDQVGTPEQQIVNMLPCILPKPLYSFSGIGSAKNYVNSSNLSLYGVNVYFVSHSLSHDIFKKQNSDKNPNNIKNMLSRMYPERSEIFNIMMSNLNYVMAMSNYSGVENGTYYFVVDMFSADDLIHFLKAVAVVTRALAIKYKFNINDSGLKNVYSKFKEYIFETSQRSLTDLISRILSTGYHSMLSNIFDLLFVKKYYGTEDLFRFAFGEYDISKDYSLRGYDYNSFKELYDKTKDFILDAFNTYENIIFGCANEDIKFYSYIFNTGDNIFIPSVLDILSDKSSQERSTILGMNHSVYLNGEKEFNFSSLDPKIHQTPGSGNLLNILTVLPFYSETKSRSINQIFKFVEDNHESIKNSGSIKHLKVNLDALGMNRTYVESILSEMGCSKDLVKFVSDMIYNNVKKNDYDMIKQRIFIRLSNNEVSSFMKNKNVQFVVKKDSSYVVSRVYNALKNNKDLVLSAYDKFLKLLIDKFSGLTIDDKSKFDYSCFVDTMMKFMLYSFVVLFINYYGIDNATNINTDDMSNIVSAMNLLSEWIVMLYVSSISTEKDRNRISREEFNRNILTRLSFLNNSSIPGEVAEILFSILEVILSKEVDYSFFKNADDSGNLYVDLDLNIKAEKENIEEGIFDYREYFMSNNLIDVLHSFSSTDDNRTLINTFITVVMLGGFYALNVLEYLDDKNYFSKKSIILSSIYSSITNFKDEVISYQTLHYNQLSTVTKKILEIENVMPRDNKIKVPTSLYYNRSGDMYYVMLVPAIAPMKNPKDGVRDKNNIDYPYFEQLPFLELEVSLVSNIDNTRYYTIPYLITYVDCIFMINNIKYGQSLDRNSMDYVPAHLINCMFYTFDTDDLVELNNILDSYLSMSADNAAEELFKKIISKEHPHMFIVMYSFFVNNVFTGKIKEYVLNNEKSLYRNAVLWYGKEEDTETSEENMSNRKSISYRNYSNTKYVSEFKLSISSPFDIVLLKNI